MVFTTKYGSLNAKVMAMRGRLLKYDDYYMLAQIRTVKDAAKRLSEYPSYDKALSGLDIENLHRDQMEQKILLSNANDFTKIYMFIGNHNARDYLDAFFLKHEIGIIKHLLSSVYGNRGIAYTIPELNKLFGGKLRIDIPRLIKSKNITEFIESLSGTEFYNVLSKKYKDDMPGLFELEVELDLYYYMHLKKLQRKYPDKRNRKAAEYINGTETDLRNIMWIYRLKRYYKINGNSIYAYIIPQHYKLSKENLIKIAESKTVAELDGEIDSSPYAYAFGDKQHIERGFYVAMGKTFRHALALYPDSLVPATAYMYFKELEIKNITALIEGIRYGLKPDDILSRIII